MTLKDPHHKLREAHERYANKIGAMLWNHGWVVDDDVWLSKTNKGILETRRPLPGNRRYRHILKADRMTPPFPPSPNTKLIKQLVGGARELIATADRLADSEAALSIAMLLSAAAAIAVSCEMSKDAFSKGVDAAWNDMGRLDS